MTALFMVAAIAIVGWFAVGTIWNVRRGGALMRWLQQGLPILGERTTVRWLGSTAVELVIQKPRAPFGRVTLVIFLEPRDLPWMWAISRSRGRRDTLIVRCELRSAPHDELEAVDPASWSGRDALRGLHSLEWSARPGPSGLELWTKDGAARADGLLEVAARCGLPVRRLSVRRTDPHLQLHVAAPGEGASASALFDAVRALGERALH